MVRTKRVGGEFLRFLDHAGRLMEIVQRGDVDQIDGQGVIADEFAEFFIGAEPLFVPGNVKLNGIAGRVFFECGKKRRALMIHMGHPCLSSLKYKQA